MRHAAKRATRQPDFQSRDCIHVETETRTDAAETVSDLWGRARKAAFPDLKLPVVVVRNKRGMRMLIIHESDLLALPGFTGALAELLGQPCV